jgi:Holliday junction resolvasome RuvABC endonuclease subunit
VSAQEKKVVLAAVDVGTDLVGVAIFVVTLRRWNLVSSKTLKAEGSSLGMRLFTLQEQIETIVRQAGATVGVLETGFVQFKHRDKTGRVWSNPVANLTLAEGRGAARVGLIRGGVTEVLEASPSQVKIAATGKGNADKWLVREMVRAQAKLNYLPGEDEADAIGAGIHAVGQMQSLEKREVFFDVEA